MYSVGINVRSSIIFLLLVLGPLLPLLRRFGWLVSRNIMYVGPFGPVLVSCVIWGGSIALLVKAAIASFHPGLLLKIIGFGAGAYVSIPNYGLFREDSIPSEMEWRHTLISYLPLGTFIVLSIVLAFFPRN